MLGAPWDAQNGKEGGRHDELVSVSSDLSERSTQTLGQRLAIGACELGRQQRRINKPPGLASGKVPADVRGQPVSPEDAGIGDEHPLGSPVGLDPPDQLGDDKRDVARPRTEVEDSHACPETCSV